MTAGAFNIIEKEGKVLLVKRRDLPLWDLPGGRVDLEQGEHPSQAAIREAFEETGLEVKIDYLIADYFFPELNDRQSLYKSVCTGGRLIKSGDETKELRYFSADQLPFLMVPHRKRQIKDFLAASKNQTFTIKESNFLKLLRKIF